LTRISFFFSDKPTVVFTVLQRVSPFSGLMFEMDFDFGGANFFFLFLASPLFVERLPLSIR